MGRRTRPRAPIAVALAGAALLGALLSPSPALAVPEGPAYPSPEWTAREAQNFALTGESPAEQLSDPAFVRRWQEQSAANAAAFVVRQLTDPEFREEGNLCASWSEQCTGDPFAYPGVDAFYDDAQVVPVEFADRDGARLSGRVWAPAQVPAGVRLPGVVVMNGSVQAPETAYWTIAQALVRSGYQVLTFDPRSAGRSDTLTPAGAAGSNANPQAFPDNLVDAIDFLASTPQRPYPHVSDPAGTRVNPLHALLDRERLGLVGHSLGAIAATIVQGYSDTDWPGRLHDTNPVDAIVALDNLALTVENSDQVPDVLDGVAAASFAAMGALGDQVAAVVPRVPAMGQAGDYFLAPVPMTAPPDPEAKKAGFVRWRDAAVPTAQLQIRGGTHYEFSRLPTFPNRSWSVGSALSTAFAVAWLDRWVKAPGEPGFADADARLLADGTSRDELSVYYRTARAFPNRAGVLQLCEDVRAGCPASGRAQQEASGPQAAAPPGAGLPGAAAPRAAVLPATGATEILSLIALALLLGAAAVRRRSAV